jgi:hypothetical protein
VRGFGCSMVKGTSFVAPVFGPVFNPDHTEVNSLSAALARKPRRWTAGPLRNRPDGRDELRLPTRVCCRVDLRSFSFPGAVGLLTSVNGVLAAPTTRQDRHGQ